MSNKQKGFSLVELIIVLVWLSCIIAIVWVAAHFIAKFW